MRSLWLQFIPWKPNPSCSFGFTANAMSRSQLSVITIVLIVLVISACIVGERTRRSHERVMESALLSAMQRVYAKAKTITPDSNRQLSPDVIHRLVTDDANRLTHLPSFLTRSNIYLPKNPVTIGSDQLFLIVQFGPEWFAIDCLGRQTHTSTSPGTNLFLPLSE